MRLSGIGYKSLIVAIALTLFALPAYAYTRTPSGYDIENPVSFEILPGDLSSWGNYGKSAHIAFTKTPEAYIYSACYNYSAYPTGFTHIETLPSGNYVRVSTRTFDEPDCPPGAFLDQKNLENDGIIFVIAGAPAGANVIVPISTGPNLLATIGDQLADPGFLLFSILAASMILGFWFMEKFLDLMPKQKDKK